MHTYNNKKLYIFKLSHAQFYKIRENNCIALYKHYNNIISSNDCMLKCLSRMKFPYGTDTQMMGGHLEHTSLIPVKLQLLSFIIYICVHINTQKYLTIINQGYTVTESSTEMAPLVSVPAMQHHVSETLADRCPIFGCLSFNIQPL